MSNRKDSRGRVFTRASKDARLPGRSEGGPAQLEFNFIDFIDLELDKLASFVIEPRTRAKLSAIQAVVSFFKGSRGEVPALRGEPKSAGQTRVMASRKTNVDTRRALEDFVKETLAEEEET